MTIKILNIVFNGMSYTLEDNGTSLEFQTIVYNSIIKIPKKLKKVYIGKYHLVVKDIMDGEFSDIVDITSDGIIRVPTSMNTSSVIVRIWREQE